MKDFYILLFVMAFFASCEKEELSSLNTEASSEVIEEISAVNNESSVSTTKVQEGWTKWYDFGPRNFGCAGPADDCMPVIVITAPGYTEVIDDLFSTVQTGEAYEIEEYIEVHLEQLSELITRRDLDKVLSHELSLSTKPYLEGKRYLLFSSTREVEKVYPFEIEQ